jgi:hypothetical protein
MLISFLALEKSNEFKESQSLPQIAAAHSCCRLRGNFMRKTRWQCYFCVKTLHKYDIEDKEITYFEKANMQKIRFYKKMERVFTQK